MSNYRRLISYIYAYEGGVKGKNVGYAKIEVRGGQCKIGISVKKIYVGSNEIGVYLLTSEQREVYLGNVFIRNGSGEFRAVFSAANIEGQDLSMDQCYGLTIHDVESPWLAYTTIWEDAVAHAAEIELAEVTSQNRILKDEQNKARLVSEKARAAKKDEAKEGVEPKLSARIPVSRNGSARTTLSRKAGSEQIPKQEGSEGNSYTAAIGDPPLAVVPPEPNSAGVNLVGAMLAGAGLAQLNSSEESVSAASLAMLNPVDTAQDGADMNAGIAGSDQSDLDMANTNTAGGNQYQYEMGSENITGVNRNIPAMANAGNGRGSQNRSRMGNANMSRSNQSRANMMNANIAGVSQSGAGTVNANMAGTNQSGAGMVDANIAGANEGGAGTVNANMAGANESRPGMADANIAGANQSGAGMVNANMAGANESRPGMVNRNRPNQSRIKMGNPNMGGVNPRMVNANMTRANQSGTRMVNANMPETNQEGMLNTDNVNDKSDDKLTVNPENTEAIRAESGITETDMAAGNLPGGDGANTDAAVQERYGEEAQSVSEAGNKGNPDGLEHLEMDGLNSDMLWNDFQKRYPRLRAFDYEHGCEILSIQPQDLGLLPREIWVYGNNSFLLHGYYNYRYLILARLNNPDGEPRFLLGVPGHYFSNEKYMASMFGFPNFVLSKQQSQKDGRFGYWYTDVQI